MLKGAMHNSTEVLEQKKLKLQRPNDAAIPLLSLDLEKLIIREGTCTPTLLAARQTIAKTWKQPKCPSIHEWLTKMRYVHTVGYKSAI